jgi:hypothetical protein
LAAKEGAAVINMNIESWLLLSIICWVFGYFNMKYLEPSPKSKLVYVPKILYFLFGAPKHKKVPARVQPVLGVYLQSWGLSMAIYGVCLDKRLINDPDLSGLLGFGVSMIIGILISRWLYRRQPYTWQNDIIIGEIP